VYTVRAMVRKRTLRDYILLEHGMPKSARVFPGGDMGQTPQTFPTIVNWLKNELI
jgi:esterase FrsA